MVALVNLPPELTLHVLWFLDLEDVIACQLTHRSLYAIIKGSILLKYFRALSVAGMEDNRLCTDWSMSERLNILRLREDAWTALLVDFSREIDLPIRGSENGHILTSYGFNGRMFLFLDTCSLHYLSLPSKTSDKIHWGCIDIGHYSKSIGFNIYEHDLIANVTWVQDSERRERVISFFEASTGGPHPLAQNSRIPITPLSFTGNIKIAGNHLALVFMDSSGEEDHIEVYDWKTGILKMKIMSNHQDTYEDVLFLSPKVLLVPNARTNTLGLWSIPESPDIVPRTCSNIELGLPPMKRSYFLSTISCQGDPYFRLHRTRYSSVPFYASATDAIVVFYMEYLPPDSPGTHRRPIAFSMIVHHQSMLDLCPTSPGSPSLLGYSFIVPWIEWGPPITRLHYKGSASEGDLSTNSSQRYIFTNRIREVLVWDFNPTRIHSFGTTTPEYIKAEQKNGNMTHTSVVTSESLLDHDCFEQPVASRLPYIQHIFRNTGILPNISIDDEWLVGFQYQGNTKKIIGLKIWHIGQAASAITYKQRANTN